MMNCSHLRGASGSDISFSAGRRLVSACDTNNRYKVGPTTKVKYLFEEITREVDDKVELSERVALLRNSLRWESRNVAQPNSGRNIWLDNQKRFFFLKFHCQSVYCSLSCSGVKWGKNRIWCKKKKKTKPFRQGPWEEFVRVRTS